MCHRAAIARASVAPYAVWPARAAAFKRGALGSLKKSRANETVLACKLLSLLAMHIGPDADATAQDLNAALRTVIDKPSMDADARAAVRSGCVQHGGVVRGLTRRPLRRSCRRWKR